MTVHGKLERDLLHADLAAVNKLLDQLHAEDVMTRFGLEARRDELLELIATVAAEPEEMTASAILFFGGGPVFGTRGIQSEFASAAVNKFQDLVAKVTAQEAGTLGQRGVVPNKGSSTLHITNIMRGSVGFVLEELQPSTQPFDTPLKTAVNEVMQLLDVFGEPDEAQFQNAIEAIDQRVFGTAREFFELMHQCGATLRLVANESECSFDVEAVTLAAERATSTTTKDSEEFFTGQLAGVLPAAHRFEFRTDDARSMITGRINSALATDAIARLGREWVDVDARARIVVKRVFRNDVLVRESCTLMSLALPTRA